MIALSRRAASLPGAQSSCTQLFQVQQAVNPGEDPHLICWSQASCNNLAALADHFPVEGQFLVGEPFPFEEMGLDPLVSDLHANHLLRLQVVQSLGLRLDSK